MTVRFLVLIYAIVGIAYYAVIVYPSIPRMFGGGERSMVQVYLNVPPDPWLKGPLGLTHVSDADSSIGPVMLLMESEHFLIVTREPVKEWSPLSSLLSIPTRRVGRAVALDKKLVAAVEYGVAREPESARAPRRPDRPVGGM